MSNITFVIFTYNEEKRIENVIKNFQNFGNILIADNQSTDRTQEIAKYYNCNILLRTNPLEFVESTEMIDLIKQHIFTEWIYFGFADEMMELKTLLEIQKIIDGDQHDIIKISRKNYFYGHFCYDAFCTPINKIFKIDAINFDNNPIHSMGIPTVPENRIYKMPTYYFVHHFISDNTQVFLDKINKYTQTELKFSSKSKNTFIFPIYCFVKFFFKHFIFKGGYKAGIAGFHLVLCMTTYYIVKNMKLYEESKNLSLGAIEKENDYKRNFILKFLL